MDLNEAHDLARALMSKHGLMERGWQFAWDRARRRLGQCDYTRRTISLSHYMVSEADVELVKQTVLHEIAHALTPGASHGPRWLAKAREIGYTGTRTGRNPYVEKQDRLRLPQHLRDIEPDTMLRPGQTGIVIRGREFTGQHVRILRRNDKTYGIVSADGRQYRIPRSSVAAVPAGVATEVITEPAAPARPLTPGETGVISVGRNRGTKVLILEKRRTRYVAVVEGLGTRLLSMNMVAPS